MITCAFVNIHGARRLLRRDASLIFERSAAAAAPPPLRPLPPCYCSCPPPPATARHRPPPPATARHRPPPPATARHRPPPPAASTADRRHGAIKGPPNPAETAEKPTERTRVYFTKSCTQGSPCLAAPRQGSGIQSASDLNTVGSKDWRSAARGLDTASRVRFCRSRECLELGVQAQVLKL